MNRYISRMRRLVIAVLLLAGVSGCATGADFDFTTTAERSDHLRTGDYSEMVEFVLAAEQRSPWVRVLSMGTTPEGRMMPLVVISKERAFSPQTALGTGKAVVLITNGIHSGEIEGKDASLQLLREIVITKERSALLDQVVLLIIPIFNIDGHERCSSYNRINQNGPEEMGWRCTAQGYNLNRDFIKADAEEMKHWLRMYHAWKPHFWFDTHTTDGADWQYDVTFIAAFGPEAPAPIAGWVREKLHPHLIQTLTDDGHCPQLFFYLANRLDATKRCSPGVWGFAPLSSTMYGALTNPPSLLVETHMLKPYKTRVRATHRLLVHALELINADPTSLIDAVAASDKEATYFSDREGQAPRVPLAVAPDDMDDGEPVTFKGLEYTLEMSEAAGGEIPRWDTSRPKDVPTQLHTRGVVSESVAPPRAYLIPPQWTDVIERLKLHGLRVDRLAKPVVAQVETYQFSDVHWRERPFEGRHMLTYKTTKVSEKRHFASGSALVVLDQPMSRVAVHLLEPDAPDSLVRWGFFDTIFEQKEYFEDYAMVPIADRMLSESPALREEFSEWLKANPDAANNPRARLDFFYRRSPYWDANKDVYPVCRVVDSIPSASVDAQ